MPSVSGAQHRFMAKAMTDPAFAKEHGISMDTASEFVHADKGRMGSLPDRVKKKPSPQELAEGLRRRK